MAKLNNYDLFGSIKTIDTFRLCNHLTCLEEPVGDPNGTW